MATPEELVRRLEQIVVDEKTTQETAEKLRGAVVQSIVTQVKWWRRFAIASFIILAALTSSTAYNYQTLNEIRKSQLSINQLVRFVEDPRNQPELGVDRIQRIDEAVNFLIRLKNNICETGGFPEACEQLGE